MLFKGALVHISKREFFLKDKCCQNLYKRAACGAFAKHHAWMLCRTRWTSSHNALKEHFPFSFSVSTENWCQIENTLLHSLIKKMEEVALEIFFDLIILGQLISKQILCY